MGSTRTPERDLPGSMDERQKADADLRTVVLRRLDELAAENAELRAANERLKRENAELRRISKQNSSNSHKPPSSDGLNERKKIRKKRRRSARKRGA
ncbi:MAG: DUF6444 domain-containing protein, partial [Myxococcota bacterium]